MIRTVYVQHTDEYLRCPLYYRYRRELQLQSNRTNPNQLLLLSARRAVQSWFSALGKGLDRHKARNKVGRSLRWLWSRDKGNVQEFPLAHARITECLLTLDRFFNQDYDTPISGRMVINVAVDDTLFEDFIDGLYLKNDKKPGAKRQDKYFVAIQIIDRKAILSDRVVQMQKAMIRYAINSAMKPNPYKIKLLQISLPDATKIWYDLDKAAYNEFLYLARSIVRHLDSKYYLPNADPAMCKMCEYASICNNHFCEPDISPQLIGRATAKLQKIAAEV